jgi:hypothetical protein
MTWRGQRLGDSHNGQNDNIWEAEISIVPLGAFAGSINEQ